MFKTIVLAVLFALLAFLGYVSTRESTFAFERSGVINAPAEKIFPYISSFQMCKMWNPYDNKDPNMKRNIMGTDGQVGSVMEFEGNTEAGSGKLEILKIVPNASVEIKLTMTKPIHANNIILYKLTPEGTGTRFTWAMSGDNGFMGKLISVFIDCEKMMAKDFDQGITQLKTIVETQK